MTTALRALAGYAATATGLAAAYAALATTATIALARRCCGMCDQ